MSFCLIFDKRTEMLLGLLSISEETRLIINNIMEVLHIIDCLLSSATLLTLHDFLLQKKKSFIDFNRILHAERMMYFVMRNTRTSILN